MVWTHSHPQSGTTTRGPQLSTPDHQVPLVPLVSSWSQTGPGRVRWSARNHKPSSLRPSPSQLTQPRSLSEYPLPPPPSQLPSLTPQYPTRELRGHYSARELRGHYPARELRGHYPARELWGHYPTRELRGHYPTRELWGHYPARELRGHYPTRELWGHYPARELRGHYPTKELRGHCPTRELRGHYPSNLPLFRSGQAVFNTYIMCTSCSYCVFSSAPVEFQTTASSVSASHSSRLRSRHKRLARSQIPSQPVEMPNGSFPEVRSN